MIILTPNLTNLVAGYDLIQNYQIGLRTKWRTPLLETYTRHRQEFESQLRDYQRSRKTKKLFFILLFALLIVILVTSLLLVYFQSRIVIPPWLQSFINTCPTLIVISFVGIVLLGVAYIYLPEPKPPIPPINPQQEKDNFLFPPLLEKWKLALASPLPGIPLDDGAIGENLFIKALESINLRSYLLYRVVQKEGDDLDIILVGEKGIWIFEVKYWSGNIKLEKKQWSQRKSYYGRKGVQQTSTRLITQPPQLQWQRMRDDLIYTISRHDPGLIKRNPSLTNVRGGVAFTHPDAAFEIPKGAGFNWGNLKFWLDYLESAPIEPVLNNERMILRIVEILLTRHQQVTGLQSLVSTELYAERLIQETETKLAAWCSATD